MNATLAWIASNGTAVSSIAGLVGLALVLLFLWAIYKRGGIDDLTRAAAAIRKVLRKR